MKKTLLLLLTALLLAGCGGTKTPFLFESGNEILTYDRSDPDKTQIIVSRTGNIEAMQLCEAFEAENPDVQVVYLDITGGNSGYQPLVEWIKRGYAPDVVISAAAFFDDKLTMQYFENLSADPVIQNYETQALQRTAVNDDVYSLPGPSNISAMLYNKTLFERYGWEIPNTFDEFVTLCDRIRADTNGEIEPWNPNAKYSVELLTAIEGFTYEEIFGGADNRSWYNDLITENGASFSHMEPYFETLQTLIDHGILREEHFTYSATARGKGFAAGKIAMINANLYDADTGEYDFGYFPFPPTKGTLGFLCGSYSCFVGRPVKEHTEKEDDAIDRFLAFFCSAKGQQAYIGKSMKVSSVKDVPLNQSDDQKALEPAISAGHLFEILEFVSESGARCSVNLHQFALDMACGKMTAADCLAAIEKEEPYPFVAGAGGDIAAVAEASEDFTVLETSFFIADAYREAAAADIGLVAHQLPYRGNVMRIFSGSLTKDFVTVLKPRSFANGSKLVRASMTGRQLLDVLERPSGDGGTADGVYAYSGLKCEIAPWNPQGERMLSVRLADGSEIKEDALYTAAFWEGSVQEGYITEILETYEGAWEELITARLEKGGAIAPAKDGRIRLVWKQ